MRTSFLENLSSPKFCFLTAGKYSLFTSQLKGKNRKKKKESCSVQNPAVAYGVG